MTGITVTRAQLDRGTVAYRIAGQDQEISKYGNIVGLNQVTVFGGGDVVVTGKFTNRQLEAVLFAIVADQRAAAQAS